MSPLMIGRYLPRKLTIDDWYKAKEYLVLYAVMESTAYTEMGEQRWKRFKELEQYFAFMHWRHLRIQSFADNRDDDLLALVQNEKCWPRMNAVTRLLWRQMTPEMLVEQLLAEKVACTDERAGGHYERR